MSFTNQCKTLGIRFLLFLFLILLENFIFQSLNTMINNIPMQYILTYSSIILLFGIFRIKNFIHDFKDIKIKELKNVIIYFLIFIVLMYISNYIIIYFLGNISDNESILRELINKNPLLMSFSVVLLAPIVEELFFRYLFFDKSINKVLSLIFSSLLFALFHVISAIDMLQLLYVIPYFFMGIAFGSCYCKTNNIFVSIIFHIFHNLFTVVLLFI